MQSKIKILIEANKQNFMIFHKRSYRAIIIHNSSVHPYQQKLLTFYTMIHRLISIEQTQENLIKEQNILKEWIPNSTH